MSATRLVMTSIVIVVAVYDLCVVTFSGNINASVSRWFASFATYPAIVFGIGYVCGHFFGWMTPTMPQGAREQLKKLADRERHAGFPLWADEIERIVR
jgi:hypothetical protein